MALPQVYPSQVDIPEPLREHYEERDSRWVLQTEPSLDHVPAMQSALDSERRLRRDAEKLYSDMKVKFEGIDPEEVTKLRDRVKGLDDADVYDKQGIEALVVRRTESMKADHERQLRQIERENAQLKDTVTTTERKWQQDRIRTALLEAVNKADVYDRAIDDAVHRGLGVFTGLDEYGNVIAKKQTPSGEELLYGKDGVNPLTPMEWIQTLKTSGDAPHLWPPSSGSGAPAHRAGPHNTIDYSKLPPAERMTLFREQQARQPS